MAFDGLLITEIFHSLQGETSLSGVPFVFVRLTGCNLRCTYCDSAYSFKGGKRMDFQSILGAIKSAGARHVLLTGGEPLLQRGTLPFLKLLRQEGYEVSIETHGEVSIETVAPFARIIMDIKTPGSGMSRGGFEQNLKFLKRLLIEMSLVYYDHVFYRFFSFLLLLFRQRRTLLLLCFELLHISF